MFLSVRLPGFGGFIPIPIEKPHVGSTSRSGISQYGSRVVQYSSRSSVVTAKFPAAQSNRSDDISSELYHFGELFTEQVWQINVMIWFRSAIQCWSQYPYCNHVGCLLLKRNKRKFEKNKIHKVKDLLFNIRRKAFSWPSVG